MRNHKRIWFFLLGLILTVMMSTAALRSHSQQEQKLENKNDATPLENMTERQRQHSRLYERPHRKDLRQAKESTQVVFTAPFIDPDDEKLPPTLEELLQRTICRTDAV